MYKTFSDLAVRDDAELRDAGRIRRLYWGTNSGLYFAAGACSAVGIALLGVAAWMVYCKLSGKNMPGPVFWPLFGTGAFGGIVLWMGWMFSKELRINPLRAYLKDPSACVFSKGSIDKAVFLSDGKRASERMSVTGTFGEGGIFIADFDPRLWSRSVADRGEEEALKPGDDWYSEKGKRLKLPLPAWVISNRATPGWGMLVGIPAETVALLKEKGKK